MQSEPDSKSPQPHESPSDIKREDPPNNKIHPQGEIAPSNLKIHEDNPLIETPLSPPNDKVNQGFYVKTKATRMTRG